MSYEGQKIYCAPQGFLQEEKKFTKELSPEDLKPSSRKFIRE